MLTKNTHSSPLGAGGLNRPLFPSSAVGLNLPSPPKVRTSSVKTIYPQLETCAWEMRLNPTPAEKVLWKFLRENKLGIKFRRQHVIDKFIVDFYCPKIGLIIEIDGDIHKDQFAYDEFREDDLKALGCKILRFENDDVLLNPEKVVSVIFAKCFEAPNP